MRRRTVLPAVLAVPLLILGAGAAVAPTDAAWSDQEWVTSSVGTLDCDDPETLARGSARGRMLTGRLLGLDLDAIAALDGVRATTDGMTATATPPSASPVSGLADAWADPLDLTALSALGLSSRGVTIPLDTNAGIVGQFAQAHGAGDFFGSSGAVTNTGLIELDPGPGGYPDLATLDLEELVGSVNPALGSVVGTLAGLRLKVGAVGARAHMLDACDALFAGHQPVREYLAAGLDLEIESPLVSSLATTVDGLLDSIEATVAGLAGDQSLLDAIAGGVLDIVTGLVPGLGLGTTDLQLSASVDLDPVREFLEEPFSDAAGLLEIRPLDGTITVDLAALVGETYPDVYSDGLNGLAPNSSLLADSAILGTLISALDSALQDWTGGVQDRISEALDLLEVSLTGTVRLRVLVPLLDITLDVHATLGDLLSGDTTVAVQVTALGVLPVPVGSVIDALGAGLGLVVGEAVNGALNSISPVVSVVGPLLTEITTLVSSLYNALFLSGVVEVTINAQNRVTGAGPPPPEWSGLTAGRYDVGALRVAVLDALGSLGVYVHLGRASVGPVCYATDTC